MVLPYANGKNTALTNGVQPFQPPRLRAPVKPISNTSCLQSSLRLLGLKCLQLLASGEKCPSPSPTSSLYGDLSVNATTPENGWWMTGDKVLEAREVWGWGQWDLFFPPYFLSWREKCPFPSMSASLLNVYSLNKVGDQGVNSYLQ